MRGAANVDINEIAKLSGVSRATVSRYLNDGYVSKEKRELISRVINETGYIPSQQARTLRTGKTKLVGVIIPKINSHSVSRMVAGITKVLGQNGYQVLLANTDNDEKVEVDYLNLFAERNKVDGIIDVNLKFCCLYDTEKKSLGDACKEAGIAYLPIETDYDDSDAGQLRTRVEAFIEMLG